MATTLKPFHLWAEIKRVDEAERIVEGYAFVQEVVEGEGGICLTRAAMEEATPDYMKWGALREMHQPQAAGTTTEIQWDGTGAYIRTKIVDDMAWKKVLERVYKGFSVGVQGLVMRGKNVTTCRWLEVSLVDRPKDPGAVITQFRADGINDEYEVQVMDELEMPALTLTAPTEPYSVRVMESDTVYPVAMERSDGAVMVNENTDVPGESRVTILPPATFERFMSGSVESTNKPAPVNMEKQISPPDASKGSKQAPPVPDAPTPEDRTNKPTPENLAKQIVPVEPGTIQDPQKPSLDGRSIKNTRVYACDMTPDMKGEHMHSTRGAARDCMMSRMDRAAMAEGVKTSTFADHLPALAKQSDAQDLRAVCSAFFDHMAYGPEDKDARHQSIDEFSDCLHDMEDGKDLGDYDKPDAERSVQPELCRALFRNTAIALKSIEGKEISLDAEPNKENLVADGALLVRTVNGTIDVTDLIQRHAAATTELAIARTQLGVAEESLRIERAKPTRIMPVRHLTAQTRETIPSWEGFNGTPGEKPQDTIQRLETQMREIEDANTPDKQPNERKRQDAAAQLSTLGSEINRLRMFAG